MFDSCNSGDGPAVVKHLPVVVAFGRHPTKTPGCPAGFPFQIALAPVAAGVFDVYAAVPQAFALEMAAEVRRTGKIRQMAYPIKQPVRVLPFLKTAEGPPPSPLFSAIKTFPAWRLLPFLMTVL